MIKPATVHEKCSLVELMATMSQPPLWFVSHWWGEPVCEFVKCLVAHARDRQLSGQSACYWICAYANNQWRLGDALTKDPSDTSFHKAIRLTSGTLSVVDKGGEIYQRIWCHYEAHVTLQDSRNGYKWDVYTTGGFGGDAAGVTDGLAENDGGNFGRMKQRESPFPLELSQKSLQLAIEDAKASEDDDRKHILNAMIGRKGDDLDAPPPKSHDNYRALNTMIRAKFAAAALRKAYNSSSVTATVAPFLAALKAGRMRELHLVLEGCEGFDKGAAAALAQSMPSGLEVLSLRLAPHATTFLTSGGFELIKAGTLASLNILANAISVECAGGLASVLREQKTLKTLCGLTPEQTTASFSKARLCEADVTLLSAELEVHPSLTHLNFSKRNTTDRRQLDGAKYDKDARATIYDVADRQRAVEHRASTILAKALRHLSEVRTSELELASPGLTSICLDSEEHPLPLRQLRGDGGVLLPSLLTKSVRRVRGQDGVANTKVSLSGMQLGECSAIVFAKLLEGNDVLSELDASHNGLGVTGADAIAKMLRLNRGLTSLNLSHTQLVIRRPTATPTAPPQQDVSPEAGPSHLTSLSGLLAIVNGNAAWHRTLQPSRPCPLSQTGRSSLPVLMWQPRSAA